MNSGEEDGPGDIGISTGTPPNKSSGRFLAKKFARYSSGADSNFLASISNILDCSLTQWGYGFSRMKIFIPSFLSVPNPQLRGR